MILDLEKLGQAVYNSLRAAKNIGHKNPIATMRTYYKPVTPEMEFLYDLFHCVEFGGVDLLYAKWCRGQPPYGEVFADMIVPRSERDRGPYRS